MEDIIILDSEVDTCAEQRAQAERILLCHLKGQSLGLTPEEWEGTLMDIGISEDDRRRVTDAAREQGLILPEGVLPERKPYRLEIGVRAFLLAKSIDANLTPREWDVLRFWSGQEDGCIHSPEETGEKFGVSKKRILMVANKVLRYEIARNMKRNLRDFYR